MSERLRDAAMQAISNMLLDDRALHIGQMSYVERDDFARDIADAALAASGETETRGEDETH